MCVCVCVCVCVCARARERARERACARTRLLKIDWLMTRSKSVQIVPRTIADNSGLNATEAVARLRAAHAEGQARAGLDVETGEARDLSEIDILDPYSAKWWALKLSVDAVTTILRVDQIIMAKPAGGPKPRAGGMDADDD